MRGRTIAIALGLVGCFPGVPYPPPVEPVQAVVDALEDLAAGVPAPPATEVFVRQTERACLGGRCYVPADDRRRQIGAVPGVEQPDGTVRLWATTNARVGDEGQRAIPLVVQTDGLAPRLNRDVSFAVGSATVVAREGTVLARHANGRAAWNDDGLCVEIGVPDDVVAWATAPIDPMPEIELGDAYIHRPTRLWSTPDGGEIVAELGCGRWGPLVVRTGSSRDADAWRVEVLEERDGATRIRVSATSSEVTAWVAPDVLGAPRPRSVLGGCGTSGFGGSSGYRPTYSPAYDRPGGEVIAKIEGTHQAERLQPGTWGIRTIWTDWGDVQIYVPPRGGRSPEGRDVVDLLGRSEHLGLQTRDGCTTATWRPRGDGGEAVADDGTVLRALDPHPAANASSLLGAVVGMRLTDAAGTTTDVAVRRAIQDDHNARPQRRDELHVGDEIWVLDETACAAPPSWHERFAYLGPDRFEVRRFGERPTRERGGLAMEIAGSFGQRTPMAFSSDGRWLVIEGNRDVHVLGVERDARVVVPGPADLGEVTPDGEHLVAKTDGAVLVQPLRAGATATRFVGFEGLPTHAVRSPDGAHVVAALEGGTFLLWRTDTPSTPRTIAPTWAGTFRRLDDLAWSDDGARFVARARGLGTVSFPAEGALVPTMGPDAWAQPLAATLRPGGAWFAGRYATTRPRVGPSGVEVAEDVLPARASSFFGAVTSPDGAEVAVWFGSNAAFLVFGADASRPTWSVAPERMTPHGAVWSDEHPRWITSRRDGNDDPVLRVHDGPDGRAAVLAFPEENVKGRPPRPSTVQQAVFSPDGRRVAVLENRTIWVWRLGPP